VSHHPPITANYAETDSWIFRQNAEPKTNFKGNILEINTTGHTHVIVKETDEHFFYTNPVTRLHNLVLGKLWLQHCGELVIQNLTTGDSCIMNFKKAGILHGGPYFEVKGVIKDEEGNDLVEIDAKWNEYFHAKWIDQDCAWSDGENNREFWRVFDDNNVGGLYDFTPFATTLNELDELHMIALPPTDSRLRPDKCLLELLQYDEATAAKKNCRSQTKSGRSTKRKRWRTLGTFLV